MTHEPRTSKQQVFHFPTEVGRTFLTPNRAKWIYWALSVYEKDLHSCRFSIPLIRNVSVKKTEQKNFVQCWSWLTLSTKQILELQSERVCRQQFHICWEKQKALQRVENTGKRKNCSSRAISPFSTVFSKDLFCRHFGLKQVRKILQQSLTNKVLIASIFSFSQNIFKSNLFQACLNSGLCDTELVNTEFVNSFLHRYSFQDIEEKDLRKTWWEKEKLLKMSNFTFFHNVFYAICILKSFNSHISVIVCSSFEFGMISKWLINSRNNHQSKQLGQVWTPTWDT